MSSAPELAEAVQRVRQQYQQYQRAQAIRALRYLAAMLAASRPRSAPQHSAGMTGPPDPAPSTESLSAPRQETDMASTPNPRLRVLTLTGGAETTYALVLDRVPLTLVDSIRNDLDVAGSEDPRCMFSFVLPGDIDLPDSESPESATELVTEAAGTPETTEPQHDLYLVTVPPLRRAGGYLSEAVVVAATADRAVELVREQVDGLPETDCPLAVTWLSLSVERVVLRRRGHS